jgi:hypothetical protein
MKTLLLSPMLRVLTAICIFSIALPACRTDAEAVCDLECECEGCSNKAFDDCYFDELNKERDADNKGCLNFYDDLKACEYDTAFCKSGNDFETSCKSEKDRYDSCKK